MTPLDTALQWLDLGIATIPIEYRGKRPKFTSFVETGDISDNGKAEWNPYKEKLPELDRVKTWFKSKFTNIAIVTGWKNLVIIDFDNEPIWKMWQSWINLKMPELLRATYRVKTRRGQHVYLFIEDCPPEMHIRTTEKDLRARKNLIDIKSGGGYCLIPPSIHPTGAKYSQNGCKPTDIVTVQSLSDVLPDMLVENASTEYLDIDDYLPKVTIESQEKIDVWSIAPSCHHENPIKWIKSNRNILEFFPQSIPGANGCHSVLCPFHNDHKTSAWINPKTNRFGCTVCSLNMDIIDFNALLKNISRKQSVRGLAR